MSIYSKKNLEGITARELLEQIVLKEYNTIGNYYTPKAVALKALMRTLRRNEDLDQPLKRGNPDEQ